jgi:hypothetical protein
MGYVGKSDHVMNSYTISRWTWKWTKKTFFHLLDLTILNSTIILASCGSKLSHWQFRLSLVWDLIQEGGRVPRSQAARWRVWAPSKSQLKRLDSRHNRCWLMQCKSFQCLLCSAKINETRTKYKLREFNIGLCATPCFEVCPTKLHFWEPTDIEMEKRNTQL